MKLEEITALLNGFGLYKIFLISYMCVLSAYGPFMSLGNAFFAAKSDHWCDVLPGENCSNWAEFLHNCTEVKRSMFLPPPDDETSKYPYSNCKQWDLPDGYVFDPYVPLGDLKNFSYSAVPCKSGWEYDTSQYKTTLISEVGSYLPRVPFVPKGL